MRILLLAATVTFVTCAPVPRPQGYGSGSNYGAQLTAGYGGSPVKQRGSGYGSGSNLIQPASYSGGPQLTAGYGGSAAKQHGPGYGSGSKLIQPAGYGGLPVKQYSTGYGLGPAYGQDSYPVQPARPYAYDYKVTDAYSGASFIKNENNNGDQTVGSYSVALPDGRVQHVKYVADKNNGFQAEVTYEGQAHYPEEYQQAGGYPQQQQQQRLASSYPRPQDQRLAGSYARPAQQRLAGGYPQQQQYQGGGYKQQQYRGSGYKQQQPQRLVSGNSYGPSQRAGPIQRPAVLAAHKPQYAPLPNLQPVSYNGPTGGAVSYKPEQKAQAEHLSQAYSPQLLVAQPPTLPTVPAYQPAATPAYQRKSPAAVAPAPVYQTSAASYKAAPQYR